MTVAELLGSATLDDSQQLSVFFINDQWPANENNRARLVIAERYRMP